MSRPVVLVAAVVTAALSLFVAGTGSASNTFTGTVGPGFTISLRLGGGRATMIKAGGRYRLTIDDRSSIHDFHLAGPGVNKVITSVAFTGTRAVLLTLKKGVYSFVCDPHASVMHGTFRVS